MTAGVEAELAAAELVAASDDLAAVANEMGLFHRPDRAPWGFGFVQFGGGRYSPGDEPAAIVAVEEGGALVDLVACGLADRQHAPRLGNAALLGHVWVERAVRRPSESLLIHCDPIAWLRRGQVGVVVVDESRATILLRSLRDQLRFDSAELAARIRALLAVGGL